MYRLKEAVIDLATRRYKLVIAATVLLTLVAGAFFPLVTLDTDPENMLEADERARVFHNQTKQCFNLSDTVVVGVVNEKHPDGVFNPDSLRRIHELTEFAKTLRWPDKENPDKTAGVIEVDMLAPSLVDHMSQQGPGTIAFEWLMEKPPTTREEALAIRDKALSNPLLVGQMVSADGKAVCIYLPLTDKLLSYRVYEAVQAKVAGMSGDDVFHITGLPVTEGAIGVEMFTQMGTASPLAMGLICALLLLFFRKVLLVALPMIISTVSIVITMGLMIALGHPVHILSSMLPIFLMSIAMVDTVHVLSEFFDVYTPAKGRRQTIKEVMHTLFAPMLYTSLTTAAGFLSLTLAPIPPARVFGVFLSIGVMVAWAVTILFVPAYIMLIPKKKLSNFGLAAQEKNRQNLLTRILAGMGRLTYRRANLVIGLIAMVVAISIYGITQIVVNDNYAKRFSHSHPIRQADTALNSHFGGTYTAYLILESAEAGAVDERAIRRIGGALKAHANAIAGDYPDAPTLAGQVEAILERSANTQDSLPAVLTATIEDADALGADLSDEAFDALQELVAFVGVERERCRLFKRPEVLRYMAKLQDHLLDKGLIGKSSSVADVVSKVNQEMVDGRPENFRIPDRLQAVSECYLQYQQSHRPHELWHMVTPDYARANIWMQFPTGDSLNTKATVAAVENYVATTPPPAKLNFEWAGLHYINLVLEAKLVWGFLKSFAGSFVIVFVMMSVLFRSPLWGLLCMLPLSITLLAIYGLVGLVGKDYDLPIAVLSALSIGMAVDFAIHFLERGRKAHARLGSWKAAAPVMFGEPARAISRNVLVIAIGFLPLLIASLVPYKTTGVMLFMILSCSGLLTLLALPAILKSAEGLFFAGSDTTDDPGKQGGVGNKAQVRGQFGRRTASLILFLSGVVVLVTSVILFIAPPTHVGHFADWRMLGLGKCNWNALHIMSGLLFLIASLFHLYFNWKAVVIYLKNRRRQMVLFTRPFTIALLLTLYVCVGALYGWAPMEQIIGWLRSVKVEHVQAYGTPPFGQAERAPLAGIAGYMGWEKENCVAALRENGLAVESPGQSLRSIADANGISVGRIIEIMSNTRGEK